MVPIPAFPEQHCVADPMDGPMVRCGQLEAPRSTHSLRNALLEEGPSPVETLELEAIG